MLIIGAYFCRFNLATEAVSITLANPPHFFREKNMQYNFKNHGRMIQVSVLLEIVHFLPCHSILETKFSKQHCIQFSITSILSSLDS